MTDKNLIKLGNRLLSLRKRKKMTLDELASKSGVSKSILSQIERDMSNPTVVTISRIANALEENLSDFFSKIEMEKPSSVETSKEIPSIKSKLKIMLQFYISTQQQCLLMSRDMLLFYINLRRL